MDNHTKVSIIIIFLNAERFIQEAIDSVFDQTYSDWELLLVDDGSTDLSTEISRQYAHHNVDRVSYIEHPRHDNRGMSASRNLGIYHARGEYVAFLDADDIWLAEKLEHQVAILDGQPEAAMLYNNTLYWHSWSRESSGRQRDYLCELGVPPDTLVYPPTLLPLFLEGKAAVPSPCSVLIRRHWLELLGGFEDCFRGLYEDQVFYAKACLQAPVYVSGGYLEKYRQHSDSSTSAAQDQERAARARYLEWLAAYCTRQKIRDTEVWRALHRECWLIRHPRLARLWRGGRRLARNLTG